MYLSSFFFFNLLASLVSCTIPATLYRGSVLSPKKVKDAGGLKAKGFGRADPDATMFQHVQTQLKYSRDQFISTSDNIEVSTRQSIKRRPRKTTHFS